MNDDQPEIAEDRVIVPTVDYGARKRRIVILLFAFAAIFGIAACFLPEENSPWGPLASLPLLVLGISWCFTDAAERHHRIGRLMQLVLVLFFLIGLPLYLFQSRGLGAFKSLALSVLLAGGLCACMLAAAFATWYVGDLTGLWGVGVAE